MTAASLNKFLFRVSNFDSLVNYLIDMTFLFIFLVKIIVFWEFKYLSIEVYK